MKLQRRGGQRRCKLGVLQGGCRLRWGGRRTMFARLCILRLQIRTHLAEGIRSASQQQNFLSSFQLPLLSDVEREEYFYNILLSNRKRRIPKHQCNMRSTP